MNRYVVDSWADEDEKNEKVKEKTVMLTQMTNKDIEEVQKIFEKYDSENQGFIDSRHAVAIFKEAGQVPSLQTEREILEEANASKTGMLIFVDLVAIFKKHWKSKEYALNELIEAVRLFGTKSENVPHEEGDENDIIEMNVLVKVLSNLGEKLEKKDIELIEKYIFKADIQLDQNNVKMQINDFVDILTKENLKKKAEVKSPKKSKGKKASTGSLRKK